MEYTIEHRTTYRYSKGVAESYTVVHLQPRSDQHQYCTRFSLDLQPHVRHHAYMDRFGNDVQHFAIHPIHDGLAITTHSSVVTLAERMPVPPDDATRSALHADPRFDQQYDFLHESPFVQFGPQLVSFRRELGVPGNDIGAWCRRAMHFIHANFDYDTKATTVRTAVDEALEKRAGVCQDFAHVMIAALRSEGIPARYVSGYVFRGDSRILGAEASHAWCEAYLPPFGWVGFDPTNDRLVNDHFVKIAIGRDYRDVSPVRGVYRGSTRSEMHVNVAMDALAGPA
ncbi:MAG: transglutaminase family protein [Vulcanimicrobiaceae bacterium]